MATDTSLGTSPENVITPTVNLARAVLFTSSAATLPRLHELGHITPSSWASDDVVRMDCSPKTGEEEPTGLEESIQKAVASSSP